MSKIIEIPDHLYKTFIEFLDLSQAAFTQETVDNMTDLEKELFSFLEQLLGEGRIMRYKTKKDLNDAKAAFMQALKR